MVAWLRALITVGFTFAGRAFMQAYKNVTANPAAARATTENLAQQAKASVKGMNVEEARMVLNLKDLKEGIEPKEVKESFLRLYQSNDVEKGGSFYLQSKIFRAKERIEIEMSERGIQFEPIDVPKPEPKEEEEEKKDEAKSKEL